MRKKSTKVNFPAELSSSKKILGNSHKDEGESDAIQLSIMQNRLEDLEDIENAEKKHPLSEAETKERDDLHQKLQAAASKTENWTALNFPVIQSINEHTMGNFLYKYLEIKIHFLISSFQGKMIVVRGKYERTNSIISTSEKNGKFLNWKRPSVEISEDKQVLYLNCFPGSDYIYHYAGIVSSYLNINSIKTIKVITQPPSKAEILKELLRTNIMYMPKCEIVILGTVEKLHALTSYSPWEDNGDFCWSRGIIGNATIVLLGCKFSFWGDIAGNLVNILAKKGIKIIIYVGKLGGLKAHMQPNTTLATGSESIVNGVKIKWKNIISIPLYKNDIVCGTHYTLPSILNETKTWFETVGYKYSFVDPEIGRMARATNKNNLIFSYIHIISDNVARVQPENLSNERSQHIIDKRLLLNFKIIEILKHTILNIYASPEKHNLNKIVLVNYVKEKMNSDLSFKKIEFTRYTKKNKCYMNGLKLFYWKFSLNSAILFYLKYQHQDLIKYFYMVFLYYLNKEKNNNLKFAYTFFKASCEAYQHQHGLPGRYALESAHALALPQLGMKNLPAQSFK